MKYDFINGHGYVAYNDSLSSNSPYWEAIRQGRKQKVQEYEKQFIIQKDHLEDYIKEIADYLEGLGKAERAKEKALLQMCGIEIPENILDTDPADFIPLFNEAITGKENFKKVMERLQKAVDYSINNPDKGALAPNAAPLFLGNFEKVLTDNISAFLKTPDGQSLMTSTDAAAWQNLNGYRDTIVDNSIDEAFTRTFGQVNKSGSDTERDFYGNQGDYDEILALYNSISPEFRSMIKNAINFDNLGEVVRRAKSNFAKKNAGDERSGARTAITKAIHASTKKDKNGVTEGSKAAARIGGMIEEFTNVMITEAMTRQGITVSGKVNKTNKVINDSVTIFSSSLDKNQIQSILQEAQEAVGVPNNLVDAARRTSAFYQNNLSRLNESLLVFTSSKNYGMGKNFSGFTGSSDRAASQIPDIMEAAVPGSKEATENFLDTVYNSIHGAVLEENQSIIKENLYMTITKAMAYLLFDDWALIGRESSSNAIHVFDLNGLQVPLSYLLIESAKVMRETGKRPTGFFRIDSNLSNLGILYPNKKYLEEYDANNKKGNATLAWNKQKADIQNKLRFSTHFISNFKDKIRNGF